ncbi:hypothetical protein BC833DRAFT_103022 [Globomyces pollinis-pini]|nr:hypothetical protein BC833DRAFT_103022 [Globomyces pollinis-pini]
MHLPVDISEWFTLSFWILSLLACPMTFIMIFNSGISNKYYKYGMSVVQIVNIVYQTIWAYYYFFNRTPIFNSIQFAASGFVFVSFAFMDIYILQLFKSLNDAISDSAIFTLKLLVLMMFPMCCFWSWIECYLHFFSLYRPPAIDMLSKWGRIIYIVGTVMYDNMQTVFITHVVNNSLKKRSGSKQLNKHMLALNTLLLFMVRILKRLKFRTDSVY